MIPALDINPPLLLCELFLLCLLGDILHLDYHANSDIDKLYVYLRQKKIYSINSIRNTIFLSRINAILKIVFMNMDFSIKGFKISYHVLKDI